MLRDVSEWPLCEKSIHLMGVLSPIALGSKACFWSTFSVVFFFLQRSAQASEQMPSYSVRMPSVTCSVALVEQFLCLWFQLCLSSDASEDRFVVLC